MAEKSQGLLSYAQIWAYLCRGDLAPTIKQETWKGLNLAQWLESADPNIQFEMLEFAPEWVFSRPEIETKIKPKTWKLLGREPRQQALEVDADALLFDIILKRIKR